MTPPGRSSLSLDGPWSLAFLDVPRRPAGDVGTVSVPGSWTLQVPGCERSHGTVRYSRTFTVPDGRAGAVVLRFGAVNHSARVLLDGHLLGVHEGGWTPFEVVVPPELVGTAGGTEHRLDVEVGYLQQMSRSDGPIGMQEIPHGKQYWYGTGAGIWQPVTLELRPARHLRDVVVRTQLHDGAVHARAELVVPSGAGEDDAARLEVTVLDRSGAAVASTSAPLPAGTGGGRAELVATVSEVHPWSPEDPYLYDVRVSLVVAGERVDEVVRRTGFRALTSSEGHLLLNGTPIEVRGVLDQDYHPGSELRAPSRQEQEELFRRAKALGFNLLRCHIKRPDPMYLELADELGLMVWAELPSWQRLTPRAAHNAETLLHEMVELDGHHPSIVVWTVANESWGVDIPTRTSGPGWSRRSRRSRRRCRRAGRGQLPVRPRLPRPHRPGGLPRLPGLPRAPQGLGRLAGGPRRPPPLAVQPVRRRPDRRHRADHRLEFGNWGLPDVTEERDQLGRYPWWAVAGEAWAFGAGRADGVRERFDDDGLDEVFGSWQQFVLATQRHQARATRYQIGSIRRRPSSAGTC
jgi:beta-galactosidase/beta-glucuronidase